MGESGFSHGALFYAGDEDFLAGTLPFIRDAVAAGEPVMVAVDERKIELLRSRLNGEGERVLFAEMHELGRNPALIMAAWEAFVAASTANGATCRGIGEPIWPERSPAELVECGHHESLLNLAFDGGPDWQLMCTYDTSALPADVLTGAEQNHPVIEEDGHPRSSPAYRDPAGTRAPFDGPLSEPPVESDLFEFDTPDDLEPSRRFVAERASAEGLDPAHAHGLALAVDEIVTNALRHGGAGGTVRAWSEDDHLVCEVAGAGTIEDPLVGRLRPALEQRDGRGLWIANHFCDLVQIRSSRAGTVVRCHLAQPAPGPAAA